MINANYFQLGSEHFHPENLKVCGAHNYKISWQRINRRRTTTAKRTDVTASILKKNAQKIQKDTDTFQTIFETPRVLFG